MNRDKSSNQEMNVIKIEETNKEETACIQTNLPTDKKIPLLKNSYHTHNERCRHAVGTIEDFVIAAKNLGFNTIGFTDHIPYKDNRLTKLRMYHELKEGYLEEIEQAKMKHPDIEILSGFECEYFRASHTYYLEVKEKVDYLILGQHYVISDHECILYDRFKTKELLMLYVESIETALDTKLFSLLAHPDVFGCSYQSFDEVAIEATHRIAKAALRNNVALELNTNGFRRKSKQYIHLYPYPLKAFWEIIAKSYPQLPVIITPDAHRIEHFDDEAVSRVFQLAKELNLNVVETLTIK